MSSGANGLNATAFGCNRGSTWNSRTVVEYDLIVYTPLLAVYNSCTPSGIVCIVYLLCDLDVYVYTLYTIHSSGAYCGGTVGTVRMMVAVNHRESMVINTGSAIISRMKPQ